MELDSIFHTHNGIEIPLDEVLSLSNTPVPTEQGLSWDGATIHLDPGSRSAREIGFTSVITTGYESLSARLTHLRC